jgi:2-oxoglutarate ferredoxin oxidoreductase subunit beta
MSFIAKPKVIHPALSRNELGLSLRDYEGGMSTLCAGCGHDSVTAALVQAAFELAIPPPKMAKLTGIGCSSKTPAYFASASHGFNSVHGRMASVATGANAANGDLYYIGVSGDGDTLSIGLGQFSHAVRRNLNMLYVLENNGVYGLTKGQFSASADVGSKAKKGEVNEQPPIDPCLLAISLGCTFVARSFSGDKEHLVPLLKAGLKHRGFAMVDVISPCVTFNDHEGSTKSYDFTRKHAHAATFADYVAPAQEIRSSQTAGSVREVTLHDGSRILLHKVGADYDPKDRGSAFDYLTRRQAQGEIVTGLLFVDETRPDMQQVQALPDEPLNCVPYAKLNPGQTVLDTIQSRFR